jgi:hypothetical protein
MLQASTGPAALQNLTELKLRQGFIRSHILKASQTNLLAFSLGLVQNG